MKIEKHGRGAEQAWQMLDTFASLGVHAFDLTQTDIDGHKRDFRPAASLEVIRRWMPYLMDSAIQYQHNLIVRPKRATTELVQLDDLSGALLERVKTAAFLILTTSPGNHQAWVAVEECAADFARRLRQGSGADASASGATRVAGSVNFKRKYAPDFPSVSLLEATPKRTVTRAELGSLGLVAAPDPIIRPGRVSLGWGAKQWPSYERCLQMRHPLTAAIVRMSAAPISRSAYSLSIGVGAWRTLASVCWSKAAKPVRMGNRMPGLPRNAPPPRSIVEACMICKLMVKTTCDEPLWTRKVSAMLPV